MEYNKEQLLQLPSEEKITLIGDLWESIEEGKKTELVPDSHRHFIRERIALDNKNQEGAIEWDSLRNKYQV